MRLSIKTAAGALFFFFGSMAFADAADLSRFFPATPVVPRYTAREISQLPQIDHEESPVDEYNAAVDLNNRALELMKRNELNRRASCWLRPAKSPIRQGFWSNYLIALRRIKGRETEAINAARVVMALDPQDFQVPYIAGLIYLNELKQPQVAADYLAAALKLAPEDGSVAVAMATALEQAGFDDDAFEILQKHAPKAGNDAYPFYLLGLQYLERRDYNPAIRAFNTARAFDEKGYAHDAWIRARYFAGQLEGLAADCKAILQRFPNVLNRESLQRMLLSLEPGDFRLIETIGLKISTPSALEKLDFLIKPIPDVANHQSVSLAGAEFISRGRSVKASIDAKEGARLRLCVPRDLLAPELRLRLTYRIATVRCSAARFRQRPFPFLMSEPWPRISC